MLTNLYYQVLVRTNSPEGHWIRFAGYINASNKTASITHDLTGIPGLSLNTLTNWTFAAGRWDDPLGDELPPLYKELALRADPFVTSDPYGNPMGDGWNNLQKLQGDMDPLESFPPPAPVSHLSYFQSKTNKLYGNAVLTWELAGGPSPDYFIIERADRTQKPITNAPPFVSPGLGRNYPSNWPSSNLSRRGTNPPPNWPTNRPFPFRGTNRPANWPTNRSLMPSTNPLPNWPTNRPWPPNSRLPFPRPGVLPRDLFVTGPFAEIPRVPSQPGVSSYRFVDTNEFHQLLQPQYRLQAHHTPPFRARLNHVNAEGIRETFIQGTTQQTTNGYAVTISNPIPYALYLLMVRDKNDLQWRASGYFQSGTNSAPVTLHTDSKGMMSSGQKPIAMPTVRFVADLIKPEFAAGWGEDSDGDGLPDIYEVMVTKTKPDNADTGSTGILDGFKEMTHDGWSNLEKFRRRVDPLKKASPPSPVELKLPTGIEILQTLVPKTDLGCEVQIAIRTNAAAGFQPIEEIPEMLSKVLNYRQSREPRNFDVRISWQFAERQFGQEGDFPFRGDSPWYNAVASLIGRINLKLIAAYKSKLETNPPLSWNEASNMTATIFHSYREGETDKGLAMAELTIRADNVSQDFYGKVMDQRGQPVVGATVTGTIIRESGGIGNESTKIKTDSRGLFQFTGLRGHSLNVALEKAGYQIEGHGVGLRNVNGPDSNPTNRAIFTMWKLKGPEPMIHDHKDYKLKADNRVYTIDLIAKSMIEGTNMEGDLLVKFQRPQQINRREHFDWSFTMSAIGGGLLGATNNEYLNEAPEKDYDPSYSISMSSTNSHWNWGDEGTFYVKSRNGKVYGHIHVKTDAESRDGSSLEIDSYINPSGSRNLEFDPTNLYMPKIETPKTPAGPP